MLVLNLLNEEVKENLAKDINTPDGKVNEPQFITYTILKDDGKVKVKCGSIATDQDDAQIPDGVYPIDGADTSLVVKDGKPEVVDNKDIPSAEKKEVKEGDVKEEMAEEQSAEDLSIQVSEVATTASEILPEPNNDFWSKVNEFIQTSMDTRFADIEASFNAVNERLREVESKLSDAEAAKAALDEAKAAIANLGSELESIKNVTPSSPSVNDSVWTKFYNSCQR